MAKLAPHHLLEVVDSHAPAGLEPYLPQLRRRAMLCTKAKVLPVECVVRGYLAGSGWKDYQATGQICGIKLPKGLEQSQALPEPIFTPATKATSGHDENITFEQACRIAGRETMQLIRQRSIQIYREAAEYARQRGLIIADTKFEWGLYGNQHILIDELLTPDSSRFWPADDYEPGRDQVSFDKQYVRNWLQRLCDRGQWNKSPPAPELPPDVVANTSSKYVEAYERLTGQRFEPAGP
ncbi:MAG: phosphoribosylaminoimidazolesuccinocarboxamide synthase [Phycisphaerae bacterium]